MLSGSHSSSRLTNPVRATVNRRVVGSSPTSGANSQKPLRSPSWLALLAPELRSQQCWHGAVRRGIQKWLEANATRLLQGNAQLWESPEFAAVKAATGENPESFAQDFRRVLNQITPLFGGFVAALDFQSRQASLDEVTTNHLLYSGDLSPQEAQTAVKRLMAAIIDEFHRQILTDIDHPVLRTWLAIPHRTILQSKPPLEHDAVERKGLLDELSADLKKESFTLLHGLPKIGKSQLVSSLIDLDGKAGDYFWFTFTGEAGEQQRLARQLCIWCGQRTSRWQALDDFQNLQPPQVFERLRSFPIHGAYIALDDCHRATDKSVFAELRRLVCSEWKDSLFLLMSEEKIPTVASGGALLKPIGGLEPKEAIEYAIKLGCDLSRAPLEFAMLSVQVGGHPPMLRAAIEQLPQRPTPAQVAILMSSLPSVYSAKNFLAYLSNRYFLISSAHLTSGVGLHGFPFLPGHLLVVSPSTSLRSNLHSRLENLTGIMSGRSFLIMPGRIIIQFLSCSATWPRHPSRSVRPCGSGKQRSSFRVRPPTVVQADLFQNEAVRIRTSATIAKPVGTLAF